MTPPATAKKSVQLSGVVVAESAVSSIDPEAGVLMYRGYDIADLAEHSTYEEVAYLLLHGELPDVDALAAFTLDLAQRELPDEVADAIDRSASAALPMDMVRTVASMLSIRVIGTICAPATYRGSRGPGTFDTTRLIGGR